jgi:hypothetical protein
MRRKVYGDNLWRSDCAEFSLEPLLWLFLCNDQEINNQVSPPLKPNLLHENIN